MGHIARAILNSCLKRSFSSFLQPSEFRSFSSSSRDVTAVTAIPEVAKLLVANRGEIACRVLATAKRLGIPTVAVFSDADRASLHAQLADQAFFIGPSAARESYLNKERILEVARRSGATAIHPGYGFLSENADFSRMCKDAGIIFVGPPASAITAMGDKSEAKAIMSAAGVPVVPGYHGEDQSEAALEAQARSMGFPILIKATKGGGGKGMKLVTKMSELQDAISSAKREAAASFGDDRILMERFIERPRHIEVQVFADSHGGAVYLFERDCSVQRRHQKVIEEAPAPGISEAFRKSIGEAAVAAARAVGYRNAGTVEFIVDTDNGDYFFMEMNTRLQVEHPVTEMITGLDLVQWQLLVAAGGKLPLRQDQLQILGHAFEARLYAESPEKDFLPATGQVHRWRLPKEAVTFSLGGSVRVDSGVREGDVVGLHYDPMIAKVLAFGPDRPSALAKLRGALAELQVSGLPTNQAFLKRLAAHPAFEAAELDTSFIKKHAATLTETPPLRPSVLALAALALHLQQAAGTNSRGALGSAWDSLDGKRLNHVLEREISFQHPISHSDIALRISLLGPSDFLVQGQGIEGVLPVKGAKLHGSRLEAEVAGEKLSCDIAAHRHADLAHLQLWVAGEAFEFVQSVPRRWARNGAAAAGSGAVLTPMPGKVIKVLVEDGQEVVEGQGLVVLEAMKMEHTVVAGLSGTVSELNCLLGAQIPDGHTLAVIVPHLAVAAAAGA